MYDTNYRDGDGVYTLDVIYYNQVVEKHDEQNGFIKTDNKVVYLYLLFSMNTYRHWKACRPIHAFQTFLLYLNNS